MYAKEHPDSTTLLPNGKIRFTQSGMEFPANVRTSVLQTYVHGRAFRRALEKMVNDAYDFEQHLPYIVAHPKKDERHFMYCTLTDCTLPRSRDVLVKHTNGKRFKRRFEEAEKRRVQREQHEMNRKKKRNNRNKRSDTQGAEEKGDKPDEAMNGEANEQDVLDGVFSSEDESAEEQGQQEAQEAREAQDSDAFWTRGRQRAEAGPSDSDQVMAECGESSGEGAVVRRERKGRGEKGKGGSGSGENRQLLVAIKQRAKKRVLEKRKVQKKVRREAQRRKVF